MQIESVETTNIEMTLDVITPQQGEIVVLRMPTNIDPDAQQHIYAAINRVAHHWAEAGVAVMVVPPEMTVEQIRANAPLPQLLQNEQGDPGF